MDKFNEMLIKYGTARIDFKNFGNINNNLIILNTNSTFKLYQPDWFNDKEGIGTVIECSEGILDLELKCVNSGRIEIIFRGVDCKDKNGSKFPIYIDYINIKINNEKILQKNQIVTFDKPYTYKKNVVDGEILRIHIEWLPFNNNSEFNEESYYKDFDEMKKIKEKLFLREKQLNSIPELSCTSYGWGALGGKLIYRNTKLLNPQNTVLRDMEGFCENQWFTRYLKHKFPDDDFKINIFSVSNPHDNLKYPMEGKKFLYSIEDLNYRYLEMKRHFDKYALDYVDLALGYDLIDDPKYIRFPFWIMSHFSPNITAEQIENKVNSWNTLSYEKTEEVVSISTHDVWGTRTIIANDIRKFVNITYAGKWNNNTSDLWNKFNNNKINYTKQFKYNLCSENVLSNGYVTEKIFDAIHCDCIPLYAGGGDYFEPEVINPNAVLRWDADDVNIYVDEDIKKRAYYGRFTQVKGKWVVNDDRNADTLELFENIISDEKSYKEFKDQDKVKSSAPKFIINKFSELEKQFERLIYN